MITALIILGSSLTYTTGWLITARAWFRRLRPFTEPVDCALIGNRFHEHNAMCYGTVTTRNEAAGWAGGLALAWPVVLPVTLLVLLAGRAIMAGDRPLRGEMEAKISRLEKELDR